MEEIKLDDLAIKESLNQEEVLSLEKNTKSSLPRLVPEMAMPMSEPVAKPEPDAEASDQYQYKDLYNEKSKDLHKLTLKMKQYDFALQEAILFLSKPMNSYQDWIDREDASSLVESIAPTISKGGRISLSSVTSASVPKGNPKLSPLTSIDSKHTHYNPFSDHEKKDSLTDLEISCLENMRLCFNFLRNCQKSAKAIDDGTFSVPIESQLRLMENESLAMLGTSLSNNPALTLSISRLPVVEERVSSTLKTFKSDCLNPTTSSQYLNIKQSDDHDISGDLSLEKLDDFQPSLPMKSSCDKCRSTLLMLDHAKDSLQAAEIKNRELEGRLQKEINARKVCQQAKAMIDSEIEEITAELFARANQMVVDESKRMDMLKTSNRELTKRVGDLSSRLKEKELELGHATKSLYELQSFQTSTSIFSSRNESDSNPYQLASSMLVNSQSQQNETKGDIKKNKEEFKHYIISGFDQFKSLVAADGYIFQEFQDLIKAMVLSANLPSIQAFAAIQNTLFMKRCMIETVEPCILYTYSPNSSFKSLGPGQSISFKRKLLDQAIKGHIICVPDQVDDEAPTPKTKCNLCTISRICEYKISYVEPSGVVSSNPKTEPACRFCRDRIMSVQDFFNYITFLSGGKHGQTILSAFKQVMWTKRRMALAMLGSCSLFETETTAILGPGSGGDWEKHTKTLY